MANFLYSLNLNSFPELHSILKFSFHFTKNFSGITITLNVFSLSFEQNQLFIYPFQSSYIKPFSPFHFFSNFRFFTNLAEKSQKNDWPKLAFCARRTGVAFLKGVLFVLFGSGPTSTCWYFTGCFFLGPSILGIL